MFDDSRDVVLGNVIINEFEEESRWKFLSSVSRDATDEKMLFILFF